MGSKVSQSYQENDPKAFETMNIFNKSEQSHGRIFSPNSPENHAGIQTIENKNSRSMFYSGESVSNSQKSDKRLQAGGFDDMKINLHHYKNEEIKYANGLQQIPEMIDARQFYLSGMNEAQ